MSSATFHQAKRPGRGDIWWSAPSYEGPAGYEDLDRMMFVVLDESHTVDRSWFGVAPIWPDTDLANELDLILAPDATSLGLPARLQLRRRITLAWEQFEAKIGEVRSKGMELVDAALAGEAGLESFGIAYESEHDWRIAADRWAAELVAELQGPYFAALQEAEVTIADTGPAPAGDLAEMVQLAGRRATRTPEDREFALAASDRGGREVIEVCVEQPEMRGYLWPNLQRAALEFHLERVAEGWRRSVELLVGLHDGRTLASSAFTPEAGGRVDVVEGEVVLLKAIDPERIRVRPVGE